MIIHSASIKGFRSLADVTVGKLGKVNILYGENGAGKSNVLAALETLFRVERVEQLESAVGVFMRGELSDFVDNFTIGKDGKRGTSITISAQIGFDDSDLLKIPKFDAFLKAHKIYKGGHDQWVIITADLESTVPGRATKTIRNASVNRKPLYDYAVSDRYFPGLSAPAKERQDSVEELFAYLINSFAVIHAERFLRDEKSGDAVISTLSSEHFKRWLLTLSESRGEKYGIFEGIVNRIKGAPFEFGIIRPFAEDAEVGLLVTDSDGRELMIERVGTGIQQIVLLISHIVSVKAKVIGIEEVELNLSPRLQYRVLDLLKNMAGEGPDKTINQLFLTSHSHHLSRRADACLYAVERDAASGETTISGGQAAVAKLRSHFDYGLFRFPRKKIWR